jgi:hypothetical protein
VLFGLVEVALYPVVDYSCRFVQLDEWESATCAVLLALVGDDQAANPYILVVTLCDSCAEVLVATKVSEGPEFAITGVAKLHGRGRYPLGVYTRTLAQRAVL